MKNIIEVITRWYYIVCGWLVAIVTVLLAIFGGSFELFIDFGSAVRLIKSIDSEDRIDYAMIVFCVTIVLLISLIGVAFYQLYKRKSTPRQQSN